MNEKDFGIAFLAVILVPLVLIVLVAVGPVMGAFAGWLLTLTPFAAWVVEGALAVGIPLTITKIPAVGAFLGFVGSFVRTINTVKNS